MKVSVVTATRNKAPYLDRTLKSVFSQNLPYPWEVIVVDDGSTDNTREICQQYDLKYVWLDNDAYRNPSRARNAGFRLAQGKVVVQMSDEVIHHTPNAIQILTDELKAGEFLIATVYNYSMEEKKILREYTGLGWKRPFFFLGSLWRKDLYAIGGYDEDFVAPSHDDNWHADCLIHGLQLVPRYLPQVVGYHQDHPRPANLGKLCGPSGTLYRHKKHAAQQGAIPYCSAGGPW